MINAVELARQAVWEHRACQKASELAQLIDFLKDERLERVLEIGSQDCGTLWLWSQLATPDAYLVALDIRFRERLGHRRAEQKVTLLEADSHDPYTCQHVFELLLDVDLLFIDGDHTYAGVKQDMELYAPLVRPGGLIILHDIVLHGSPGHSEVERFWNEIKSNYEHHEFASNLGESVVGADLPPNSCGLGVLRKGEKT